MQAFRTESLTAAACPAQSARPATAAIPARARCESLIRFVIGGSSPFWLRANHLQTHPARQLPTEQAHPGVPPPPNANAASAEKFDDTSRSARARREQHSGS